MRITHVDLPGSHRPAKRGAQKIGPSNPKQRLRITAVVRRKQALPEPDPAAPMEIAEIERQYGAAPTDMEQVVDTFWGLGLTVTNSSPGAGTVEAEGTVAQMENAFAVDLEQYRAPDQGEYRGREGDIRIPAQLDGIVTAILGLDERRVARRKPVSMPEAPEFATTTELAPQRPADLTKRYAFPLGGAAGQTVGVFEFGGGFWESDLSMYCDQIAQQAVPGVTIVPVGLQSLSLEQIRTIPEKLQRENELDSAEEVNMDVQIVAGLCPQAAIQVYFAPFTQKGWVDILTAAIHRQGGPTVISVSWGSSEDTGDLTSGAIQAINSLLQTAALAGITVCVSSGDDGAGDAVNDGRAHCDFPSSSPYILAVGGTMFPNGGPETGWWDEPGMRTNDGGGSSGGGRSVVFPTPSWQNVSVVSVRTGKAAGRCIPDVAALSGGPLYDLILAGQSAPNGGTSASAPLWASLLARIAANLPAGQKLGFLTPRLYRPGPDGRPLGASISTDITVGRNDVLADEALGIKAVTGYEAGPGYDAVTGWGVPYGVALQAALTQMVD